jgi:hypothetical protein
MSCEVRLSNAILDIPCICELLLHHLLLWEICHGTPAEQDVEYRNEQSSGRGVPDLLFQQLLCPALKLIYLGNELGPAIL